MHLALPYRVHKFLPQYPDFTFRASDDASRQCHGTEALDPARSLRVLTIKFPKARLVRVNTRIRSMNVICGCSALRFMTSALVFQPTVFSVPVDTWRALSLGRKSIGAGL